MKQVIFSAYLGILSICHCENHLGRQSLWTAKNTRRNWASELLHFETKVKGKAEFYAGICV